MNVATLLCLLVVALPATVTHAEIFKCAGKAGIAVYQNFPCEFDSATAVPTPRVAPALPAPVATPAKSALGPDAARHHPAPVQSSMPRVGMSMQEIRTTWGAPMETSKEEHADADIEIWSYAGPRSIQFDRKGRVTAVHWY